MIEILIPTYNRGPYLLKNLLAISSQLLSDNICHKYRVLISDNCSTDRTFEDLSLQLDKLNFSCTVFRQDKNVGLEQNAIFLLSKASSRFFFFLGDDDYLPAGYLAYLLGQVERIPELSCVIPGFSVMYPDGRIESKRKHVVPEIHYLPSFRSVLALSHYGHQLSGLLFRRDSLLDHYLAKPCLRNLYPWIFFVGFNASRGISVYAPLFEIAVTTSNHKDWSYDNTGLLRDIVKNHKMLYPCNWIKSGALDLKITLCQSWRVYVGFDLRKTYHGFRELFSSPYFSPLFRAFLPFVYLVLVVKRYRMKSLSRRSFSKYS